MQALGMEGSSVEKSAKRRRAGELGLLPAATPPPPAWPADAFASLPATEPAAARDDADEDVGKPDVFEYFAQRASKQRELEEEVARLQRRGAQLAARVEEAELTASQLRSEAAAGTARQQAQAAQLEVQLREQAELLQMEVERSAGLGAQLRAAQAAAEAARQRAAEAQAAAHAEAAQPAAADHPAGPAAGELRLQVTQLQMQVEQLAADKEDGERRAAEALATAQRRCENEAAAARMLQRQLEEAVALAEGASAARHSLEAALAGKEQELVALQTQLEGAKSSGGDGVLVKSLRNQLQEQEALVADARRLREQAQ